VSAKARPIFQSETLENAEVTGSLLGNIIPEGATQTRPAKILDFGAINSSTIDALRPFFWGRLTVLDAIYGASELERLLSDPEDEVNLALYLEDLFAPAIGQAYDLVLLWDFAASLSDANLPWLDRWLDSFVTEGGYAHGFICHNPTRKIEKKGWGLHSKTELTSKLIHGFVPHQHLRNQFSRHLRNFVIEKSVLLKDGRLEVLLKRR
jgi:hypothetical protein